MRIGLAFDLRYEGPLPAGTPDDLFEEFDSPETVAALGSVLRDLGHEAIDLGNGPPLVRRLLEDPPDLVFNFAEGQGVSRSREARVPGVLETLNIPYSGSDPATLGVCLDKEWTRRVVAAGGVTVPHGLVADPRRDDLDSLLDRTGVSLPLIVKPVFEGSSKGIHSKCIIERRGEFVSAVKELAGSYQQPVLVEEFVSGEELTVGIIGNEPRIVFGIMRVLPRKPSDRFIYSLDVKRNYQQHVDYECPARIGAAATQAVEQAALRAFNILGCRDVARLDFRLRDGVPYFLEINPLPGLHPVTGDLIVMAKALGMSYGQVIERILGAALNRYESSRARRR
jgi:D-alanine-D-alanine ligase